MAPASAADLSAPLPVDPSAQVVPRGLPLGMDMAVLRARPSAQGDEIALVADGDVLRDGRGNPAAGDKIKIVLRPETACYVYVVGIDGSGLVRSLFPPAPGYDPRPVMPSRDYTIPQGREWAALDEVRGVETLYVIASPEPRPDLDQALKAFEVRPRSIGPITAKVEEPAILPADYREMEKGRSASIDLESGRRLQVPTHTYVAAQAGEALRLTRWFRHE